MVAQESNTYLKVIKQYKKKVEEENLALLTLALNNLPAKLENKVSKFLKFKEIIKKEFPSPMKNKEFRREIKELTKEILMHLQLSPRFFINSIWWYLLYDEVKAPFMNFLIRSTEDSVVVEYFRSPTRHDKKMADAMIEHHFNFKPVMQKIRIDPRNAKTIMRKIISSKYQGYEALEELYGDLETEDPSITKKRLSKARSDKKRLTKLKSKLV